MVNWLGLGGLGERLEHSVAEAVVEQDWIG